MYIYIEMNLTKFVYVEIESERDIKRLSEGGRESPVDSQRSLPPVLLLLLISLPIIILVAVASS